MKWFQESPWASLLSADLGASLRIDPAERRAVDKWFRVSFLLASASYFAQRKPRSSFALVGTAELR